MKVCSGAYATFIIQDYIKLQEAFNMSSAEYTSTVDKFLGKIYQYHIINVRHWLIDLKLLLLKLLLFDDKCFKTM